MEGLDIDYRQRQLDQTKKQSASSLALKTCEVKIETPTFNSGRKAKGRETLPKQAKAKTKGPRQKAATIGRDTNVQQRAQSQGP